LEQGTRDGYALFLPAGEEGSFGSAEGLEARGERGDEVVDVGGLAGADQLRLWDG